MHTAARQFSPKTKATGRENGMKCQNASFGHSLLIQDQKATAVEDKGTCAPLVCEPIMNSSSQQFEGSCMGVSLNDQGKKEQN